MCGIFVHIFFLTPKSRREIAEILINGLKAQEYRGYDSAGKYKSFIFRRFLLLYVVINKEKRNDKVRKISKANCK